MGSGKDMVDLRKAYDSVSRQALWKVLEKYGVPEKMLNVVKSFHEGMHAEVRVGSTVTDRFEVRNGAIGVVVQE